jgi:hypothetical protein
MMAGISIYETNDRSAAVKRRINERLGSAVIKERSYAETPAAPCPAQNGASTNQAGSP